MKKIGIFFTLVVLLAMIPLTYVIGRGGGHRGGGRGGYSHSGHRGGSYGHRGYNRGGRGYYGGYGYSNAAWAIPLAVGTAAAIGSAAASSSSNNYDDTTYYPEDYYNGYEYQDKVYTTPETAPIRKQDPIQAEDFEQAAPAA